MRARITKSEKVFSIRLRVNQGAFTYRMNNSVFAEMFGGPCVYLGKGLNFDFGPNVPAQRSGKTSIVYTY